MLLDQNLLVMVERNLTQIVEWLGKHLRSADYTVRLLKNKRNKLYYRMKEVMANIQKAAGKDAKGWLPNREALGWVRNGLNCMAEVQKLVNEHRKKKKKDREHRHGYTAGGSRAAEFMLHCPCHNALSRRMLNADALRRIYEVDTLYKEGEEYAEDFQKVATKTDANKKKKRWTQKTL